ncbi:MAG TPA: acyl-CoA dehydrogenase [Syntrophomonadaceae bacterium]|nr:acyl-CoA dehydrogenase [Syntrophomonadaceae bacterium]HPR94561.1 acyl-CoA dehydrogenase [Syntrophomonadaceae bacterium]
MRDIKFQMKEWLDMDKLLSSEGYKDYYGIDDIDGFLDVNYKICRDVMCPANKDADEIGMKFVGGTEKAVESPAIYKSVYNTIMDAGLGPQFGDRQSEGRMPLAWYAPILEMQIGASPAIPMLWCLTQGASTVIQFEGTEKQKELYLPKLYTGEWGGSMCLTEPGAGSEVGNCATKAFATDTHGLYKIKGQKCFITSGDHDCVENIIHLVLAKTEGAKDGTAGISLFIVPKNMINDDGSAGDWNDVTTVGIEHKLGIHGSATCTLAFGENNNCFGWLVGDQVPVEGRGKGMAQMFRFMNEERLNTGTFSLGCIGAAYYSALDYSKVRVQGRKSTDPKGGQVRIIEHEDVRRMLMLQKSCMEAIRALIYQTYYYVDLSHEADDPAEREYAEDMFMINNPLCKAYASDMAWILTQEAMQVHGGYGFMEEYSPASLARDCKIYSIWEGTNFIQSQDFTGRKFTMKDGEPFRKWVAEITDFLAAKKIPEFADEFAMMDEAVAVFKNIVDMNAGWTATNKQLKQLFATRTLHAAARVYCGKLILDQGVMAAEKLAELGEDHFDANFYKGKIASARFYVMNVVPEVLGFEKAMKNADTSSIDIAEDSLM